MLKAIGNEDNLLLLLRLPKRFTILATGRPVARGVLLRGRFKLQLVTTGLKEDRRAFGARNLRKVKLKAKGSMAGRVEIAKTRNNHGLFQKTLTGQSIYLTIFGTDVHSTGHSLLIALSISEFDL